MTGGAGFLGSNIVNELLNLFKIFSLENKFNFDSKNVLDAGTGTGHRIVNVALNYKKTHFLGLDFSKKSIQFAQKLAKKAQEKNISKILSCLFEVALSCIFSYI